jgi:hypothetical protein
MGRADLVENGRGQQKMRRLTRLAFGLFVALVLVASGVEAGTGNVLDVGDQTANPGDTGVQITVDAATSDPLTALIFNLRYSETLCSVLSNHSVTSAGRTVVTAELSDELCVSSSGANGGVQVNISDPGGISAIPAGTGAIVIWTFDIAGGASGGQFAVSPEILSAQNGIISVTVEPVGGTLTITGPTAVPTEVPTEVPTAVPTEVPTEIPTEGPTEVPTAVPTETPTEMGTATNTGTPTETPTETQTFTPTNTPTNTPVPSPMITGGALEGSTGVVGTGAGNTTIEIRTEGGGETLGSGSTNASGNFNIGLSRPLVDGERIVAVDTGNGITGPPVTVRGVPAQIPALGDLGALALALILAFGLLWRVGALRRQS